MTDTTAVLPSTPDSKARRKRRNIVIGLVAAVALLLIGAVAVCAYYSGRTAPNTKIGAHSVGGMKSSQVQEFVTKQAAALDIKLAGDMGPKTVKLADAGISVDAQATAASVVGRHGFFAPLQFWKTRTVPAVVHTDAAKMTAFITENSQKFADQVPVEPTITIAEGADKFTVTPGKAGRGIDAEKFSQDISAAASQLKSAEVVATASEREPQTTTAAAQELATQAEALVAPAVVIKTDTNETVTADAATKLGWVKFASPLSAGAPEIDTEKVNAWVQAQAEAASTEPANGVRNVNDQGEVVRVVKKPVAGYKVNNTAAVSANLVTALGSKQEFSGEFDYDKTEGSWEERVIATGAENLAYPAAPGEKWIDVSLANRTVTAYEGATVKYGPIPMVPGAPETPTVTGTFKVWLKNRTQTMRGENVDGSRYETPDVPWIMYFHGSYALHGAYWRSTFGWGARQGSHGCVNLPVGDARELYNFAPLGTVVVVH